MPAPFRWGTVGLGAVAGLLLMVVAGFLGTALLWLGGRLGLATGRTATLLVLSLSLLAGEFVGGYVAGRLAGPTVAGLHGSLAALGAYTVFASLSLLSGSPAGVPTLVVFGVVAAVIGYGGGTLGQRSAGSSTGPS